MFATGRAMIQREFVPQSHDNVNQRRFAFSQGADNDGGLTSKVGAHCLSLLGVKMRMLTRHLDLLLPSIGKIVCTSIVVRQKVVLRKEPW